MGRPYLTHVSTALAKAQGLVKERRLWEPEVIDDYNKMFFSGHNREDACVISLIAIAHAKPIQTQVRIDARMELEMESHFCIKSYWQLTAVRRERERCFSLRL